LQHRAEVVRDEEGEPLRMVGTVQDVSERKRAEEEIRELNETLEKRIEERTERLRGTLAELAQSVERYRAVIEQSAEGIYLLDVRTMRIVESNPALQEMLGYTAEELQEMEVYDLIALPREEVVSAIQDTLRERRRLVGERVPSQGRLAGGRGGGYKDGGPLHRA